MNNRMSALVMLLALAGSTALLLAEGSVKGVVKWDGNVPPRKKAQLGADPYCQKFHKGQPMPLEMPAVVNDNQTLKHVFVYVKSGLPAGKTWPVPESPVKLNQHGCTYVPHVFGIMVGQELVIHNDDDTSHNVNCSPKNNTGFNQGQPKKGMELKKNFSNPEMMVPFKCDVHPWMSAYCAVMDHPFYAVSGNDGTFEIKDLPPGEYVLEAWHEHPALKSQEMTVVVKDGETASAEFTFSPPKRKKMSAGSADVPPVNVMRNDQVLGCPKCATGKPCCNKCARTTGTK